MAFFIEPSQSNQTLFKLIEHGLNFSLDTVDVQILGTRVACLAGRYIRLKGVIVVLAQVTSNTGVFHHGVVRAWAAFDVTGASNAEQHRALPTVVRTPVAAGDLDHAVHCFSNPAARLVAVGAQITFAAVEGHALKGIKVHWFRGL
jgi:hypothetical protein